MDELKNIMNKFVESGWDLIQEPARAWLHGEKTSKELIPIIKQAEKDCGSCGCEFDPLYKRAIELLSA